MTAGEGESAGSNDEAHKEAVEAVRAAVVEIRTLNSQEGSEDAMKAAKMRLALAIKAATAAGASQEELIEASNPPAESSADEALKVGDAVEIFGLESESGKQLNGKTGTIVAYVEEKERFQIELGGGSRVSVRPVNLRREGGEVPPEAAEQDPADAGEGAAASTQEDEDRPLATGDRVEVFGLASESGAKLNGRLGEVIELLETGRAKVQLSPTEAVSIKPANLRRQRPPSPPRAAEAAGESEAPAPPAAAAEEGGEKPAKSAKADGSDDDSSSSSSSSAGPRRPRKRRANNFGGGEAPRKSRKDMTPEEKLEALLSGQAPLPGGLDRSSGGGGDGPDFEYSAPRKVDPADIEKDIARAAGAAAAAAAAAAKEPLRLGDKVEVHGLMSAAGRPMNGKTGIIVKFDAAKGRFMVELGMPTQPSLKPENLRHVIPANTTFENNYGGSTAGYTLL